MGRPVALIADDRPDAAIRPLMLGYVRAHLLMTERELSVLKQELARFAQQEGYALGTVYVERIDRIPAALGALLEAVERERPAALVVPSVLHLAPLGLPPKVMHFLEATTGVRVLVAKVPP
jgi:hypothetical protein